MWLKIQIYSLIQRIIQPWTFVRFLYLFIGGSILYQAILDGLWFGILFGSYFMAMGLFSMGCASGNCAIPVKNSACSSEPIE